MKKADRIVIGWLIVIGIIAYPFVSLYEKIGRAGVSVIAIIAAGLCVFYYIAKRRIDQEKFNNLALYVLYNRIHPDEAKKMNLKLLRTNFPRAALIRNLQIIRDSIEISLASKKRDIAESRMKTVLDLYGEITRNQSALVSLGVYDEIGRVVQDAKDKFQSTLSLNMAAGYMLKAENLKTKKSKEKYIDLAIDALSEGIGKGYGQEPELRMALSQAIQTKASLE